MKLNNKGFAVSIILYSMIAVITIILLLILSIYTTNIHNKMTQAERIKEKISGLNTLTNKIFRDNTQIKTNPVLDTNSATTEKGLYKSIVTNSGQPTYYFRGNVDNNYVKFGKVTSGSYQCDIMWRIVRINEDGTIRIVYQGLMNPSGGSCSTSMLNKYYDTGSANHPYPIIENDDTANYNIIHYNNGNIEKMDTVTANKINHKIYYSNNVNMTEVRGRLENWYTINIKDKYSSKVVEGDYFCEQNKVAYNNGEAYATVANPFKYDEYTANFNCGKDGNGYSVVNSGVGLLTYDEVVSAGGYPMKENKKYYLYNGKSFWTMSPSHDDYIWGVSQNGSLTAVNYNSQSYEIRPVIILKSDVIVDEDGIGTSSKPYVIK